MSSESPEIVIYVDGGCWPNPGGPGGWAAIVTCGTERAEYWGYIEPPCTNNRAELLAAIYGLTTEPAYFSARKATVVTDSQYLKRGATVWMPKWRQHGFKRRGKLIPNADLWGRLSGLLLRIDVSWKWVRGHNKCEENNRADFLAYAGRVSPLGPQENLANPPKFD